MINIICEVYGVVGTGNGAVINELLFFDKNNNIIPYSVTSNDISNNVGFGYWNQTKLWDKARLNDGVTTYNFDSSTLFLYGAPDLKTAWNRFLINLNTDDIKNIRKIVTYIGDNSQRTPISISYFYSSNYNKTNDLNNRDNAGLKLLRELNFSSVVTKSTAFDINIQFAKYLIKQDDKYYSIKPEFYQNGQLTSLTLSGGDKPNDDDYNNQGFDDINTLCTKYNTENYVANGATLDDGKLFTFDIPKNIKNINNIE